MVASFSLRSQVSSSGRVTSDFLRQALDGVQPTVVAFANRHNGKAYRTQRDLIVRVATSEGLLTLQVSVLGNVAHPSIEVTGVRRNGMETKRTVFAWKPPVRPVDLAALDNALERALVV